jgi:cytochrome b561
MVQDIPRSLQDPLFILHKGLGPLVLVVVLLRLAWRATHPAPPLPASVPPLQARLAGAVHAGLYIFLIVQAVSGYVRVTTGGFPIEALDSKDFVRSEVDADVVLLENFVRGEGYLDGRVAPCRPGRTLPSGSLHRCADCAPW